MACFSGVFIQQITCICANNTVNKKKSSVQKQCVALLGLEKTKENCRHASAETSKAFSLQGKYLKANIQLTLLLLQTPVTSLCSILACRVVQRHADRCLDKNIFLYSQQDAFWRKICFFLICCKSSKNQSIIYQGFQIFMCKYYQRHWRKTV